MVATNENPVLRVKHIRSTRETILVEDAKPKASASCPPPARGTGTPSPTNLEPTKSSGSGKGGAIALLRKLSSSGSKSAALKRSDSEASSDANMMKTNSAVEENTGFNEDDNDRDPPHNEAEQMHQRPSSPPGDDDNVGNDLTKEVHIFDTHKVPESVLKKSESPTAALPQIQASGSRGKSSRRKVPKIPRHPASTKSSIPDMNGSGNAKLVTKSYSNCSSSNKSSPSAPVVKSASGRSTTSAKGSSTRSKGCQTAEIARTSSQASGTAGGLLPPIPVVQSSGSSNPKSQQGSTTVSQSSSWRSTRSQSVEKKIITSTSSQCAEIKKASSKASATRSTNSQNVEIKKTDSKFSRSGEEESLPPVPVSHSTGSSNSKNQQDNGTSVILPTISHQSSNSQPNEEKHKTNSKASSIEGGPLPPRAPMRRSSASPVQPPVVRNGTERSTSSNASGRLSIKKSHSGLAGKIGGVIPLICKTFTGSAKSNKSTRSVDIKRCNSERSSGSRLSLKLFKSSSKGSSSSSDAASSVTEVQDIIAETNEMTETSTDSAVPTTLGRMKETFAKQPGGFLQRCRSEGIVSMSNKTKPVLHSGSFDGGGRSDLIKVTHSKASIIKMNVSLMSNNSREFLAPIFVASPREDPLAEPGMEIVASIDGGQPVLTAESAIEEHFALVAPSLVNDETYKGEEGLKNCMFGCGYSLYLTSLDIYQKELEEKAARLTENPPQGTEKQGEELPEGQAEAQVQDQSPKLEEKKPEDLSKEDSEPKDRKDANQEPSDVDEQELPALDSDKTPRTLPIDRAIVNVVESSRVKAFGETADAAAPPTEPVIFVVEGSAIVSTEKRGKSKKFGISKLKKLVREVFTCFHS